LGRGQRRPRVFGRAHDGPHFRLNRPQPLLDPEGMHPEHARFGKLPGRVQLLDLLFNFLRPPARLEMQTQQVPQVRVLARNGMAPPAFEFVFSSHTRE